MDGNWFYYGFWKAAQGDADRKRFSPGGASWKGVFIYFKGYLIKKKKSPNTVYFNVQELASGMHLVEKKAVKSSPSTVPSYQGSEQLWLSFLQETWILKN